jgi:hypothetical protein
MAGAGGAEGELELVWLKAARLKSREAAIIIRGRNIRGLLEAGDSDTTQPSLFSEAVSSGGYFL